MLTELVERIYIDSDKSVRAELRYQDELNKILALAEGKDIQHE